MSPVFWRIDHFCLWKISQLKNDFYKWSFTYICYCGERYIPLSSSEAWRISSENSTLFVCSKPRGEKAGRGGTDSTSGAGLGELEGPLSPYWPRLPCAPELWGKEVWLPLLLSESQSAVIFILHLCLWGLLLPSLSIWRAVFLFLGVTR